VTLEERYSFPVGTDRPTRRRPAALDRLVTPVPCSLYQPRLAMLSLVELLVISNASTSLCLCFRFTRSRLIYVRSTTLPPFFQRHGGVCRTVCLASPSPHAALHLPLGAHGIVGIPPHWHPADAVAAAAARSAASACASAHGWVEPRPPGPSRGCTLELPTVLRPPALVWPYADSASHLLSQFCCQIALQAGKGPHPPISRVQPGPADCRLGQED
jgi:hypothetical protein